MTCVVALKHGDKIYMGADSAGTDNGFRTVRRKDPKIYKVGDMLIGFTSSFRMGQLLGHSLTLPPHDPKTAVYEYMVTAFMDAVRNTLRTGGYLVTEDGNEAIGTFLVAYKGHIFEIGDDLQVGESIDPYQAVGCGIDLALGSLFTSSKRKITNPKDVVKTALQAATEFSAGVRGPYLIEVI